MRPLIDLDRDVSVDPSGEAAGRFSQKLARGGTIQATSRGILDALPDLLKELLRGPHRQIENRIYDLNAAKAKHDRRTSDHFSCLGTISDAMSGDMALVLVGDAVVNVTAAALNAAAAGTFKRPVSARLENTVGDPHRWARLAPLVTPSESAADPEIGAPTIEGAPAFKDGIVTAVAVFDTDAGATKTYAAADSVAVKIQANAADSLLGYSLTADGVTKTFNVV